MAAFAAQQRGAVACGRGAQARASSRAASLCASAPRASAAVARAPRLAARHAVAGAPLRGAGASSARAAPRSRAAAPVRALTITETFVDMDTPTGKMRTYVLKPTAPGKYPGIVFYSEIFQVTGPVRRSAQIMACHGFVVALPEIYHEYEKPGVAFSYEGKAGVDRGNELKITKPIAAYDSDSAATVAFLMQHPDCTGAVGVMGFCIGGHLAYRAALNKGVRAAACFYATDLHKGTLGLGMSDNSLARAGELAAAGTEMCMIWGRQDPHVPLDGRKRTLAALEDAGVNFSWHEFNGQHAFMRDEGPRYDGELAMHCYALCVALFRRKLGAGDLPVPGGASKAVAGESKH